MNPYDLSHVTDVGAEFSAGPPVSIWDMVQQGTRQQYRVDSQRALDEELQTRWQESLRALSAAGQRFNSPVDPLMYRGFARFVREGTPVTMPTVEGSGYGARINYDLQQPNTEFEEMRRANEAIRQLNNPEIKSFEQILEEVSQMQRDVEQETAAMSERGGWSGFLGELAGAMAGSFTLRDPLNVITAPIGAGRTIATRIATDMAVAAGVVTATEYGDVQPNRTLAGLPERNPLFNIAAATIGAGVIRGAVIEPIAYGVRRLRERPGVEDIDFDLRDSQLQQMFGENPTSPTARAASSLLDDTVFIERNNPYGEGRAASERFIAELQAVQRSMNGEPMTAVARVLPPMPFEYIQKAADFEIVREQAPLVYARMEQTQRNVEALNARTDLRSWIGASKLVTDTGEPELLYHGSKRANLAELTSALERGEDIHGGIYLTRDREHALAGRQHLYSAYAKIERPFVIPADASPELRRSSMALTEDKIKALRDEGYDGIINEAGYEIVAFDRSQVRLVNENEVAPAVLAKQRRAANKEYQTAYRAVEAEAARLHEAQARVEAAQQREASNILAAVSEGRPFVGPLLRYDNVESLVDRINAFNDTLDEATAARFVRQAEGEVPVREAWLTEDGRVDIGLREPVDPDFRVPTEDGDISIADAMRDLQDDADLVEAIRSCSI